MPFFVIFHSVAFHFDPMNSIPNQKVIRLANFWHIKCLIAGADKEDLDLNRFSSKPIRFILKKKEGMMTDRRFLKFRSVMMLRGLTLIPLTRDTNFDRYHSAQW